MYFIFGRFLCINNRMVNVENTRRKGVSVQSSVDLAKTTSPCCLSHGVGYDVLCCAVLCLVILSCVSCWKPSPFGR